VVTRKFPRSQIARTTPDRVEVRGFDLANDLLGRVDFGEMAFLELTGRLPEPNESIVFNAMLVALVEHGITPSTLAARLTYLGAPDALQASVAAGILGLGTVFVGTIEGAARMIQEALPDESHPTDLESTAAAIVREYRRSGRLIPGLGHPIHKPADPRTTRLFELAAENNLSGRYVELMRLIARQAERQTGRVLPVNATGAIGALASEMGIPWQICRGLGIMARAVGLVGHLLEEIREPVAGQVWSEAQAELERASD